MDGEKADGWKYNSVTCLEDSFTVSKATISLTALLVQGHFTSCENLYITAIHLSLHHFNKVKVVYQILTAIVLRMTIYTERSLVSLSIIMTTYK